MNIGLYLRQAFTLLFGNGTAQLINLASYVALARLYGPAEIGGFAIFLTVIGLFGPVSNGRFDLIIQSAPNRLLPALVTRARRTKILVSLTLSVLGAAYALYSGSIRVEEGLLIGLGVFLSGSVLSLTARLIREERYKVAARSTVIRSAATGIAQIGLWWLDPSAFSLIVGFCVGFGCQVVILQRALRDVAPATRSTRKRERVVLARYARQISLDIPTALLGAAVLNIINFLVLDLYSREDVGYYSLAYRVAALPLTLISGALAEVFYQKASASYRATGGFWRELQFNLVLTISISVLVVVPLAFLAPPVFAVAFGEQWVRAGNLVICLLPLLAVRLVTDSVQIAPLVIGRAGWRLSTQIALLAVIGLSFLVAKIDQSPIERFLFVTSLLTAIVYGTYVILMSFAVRRKYRGTETAEPAGTGTTS